MIPSRWNSRFPMLGAIRHSTPVRKICAAPMYPVDRFRQAKNEGRFAFDLIGNMGMGAALTHIVKLIAYSEDSGQLPVAKATSELYSNTRGHDWLSDFFPRLDKVNTDDLRFLKVANEMSYGGFPVRESLSLSEAHLLFTKYHGVSNLVLDVVNDVLSTEGVASFEYSIHFRGTDKFREIPSAEPEDIFRAIENAGLNSCDKAFLATDTAQFERQVRERFPRTHFVKYAFDIADQEGPRHFSILEPKLKALEAAANILLLSRSRRCFRTSSYLSAWSRILNPGLEVNTFNAAAREKQKFPEREIINSELR